MQALVPDHDALVRGTNELGIEGFLMKRAQANGKPIFGLDRSANMRKSFPECRTNRAELVLLRTLCSDESETTCEKDARSVAQGRFGHDCASRARIASRSADLR